MRVAGESGKPEKLVTMSDRNPPTIGNEYNEGMSEVSDQGEDNGNENQEAAVFCWYDGGGPSYVSLGWGSTNNGTAELEGKGDGPRLAEGERVTAVDVVFVGSTADCW